jgi:RNA polymerase sigma-70 factor, ECF subfamily
MQDENIKDQQELLARCIDGDNRAWTIFVRRFAPLVYRAIRQRAAISAHSIRSHEIDDIFQQTFTNIWQRKSLAKVMDMKSLPAYLAVSAHNTALDFLRSKTSQEQRNRLYADNSVLADNAQPLQEGWGRGMDERVDRCLQDLPVKERRIITLELFYNLKHREIACIMDMPLNTVSTIIARIKKTLKNRLKEE